MIDMVAAPVFVFIIGWFVWATRKIMEHERVLTLIVKQCEDRCHIGEAQSKAVNRIERNILRIGVSLGIDNELEPPNE